MAAITSAANNGGIDTTSVGKQAIQKLKSTDPPVYLSPSPDLSESARLASEYLFSSLKPYAPKSPFSHLLVKGFDAEQIWQQIDIQSQPLISSLRRKVQSFEKNPEEIKSLFSALENGKPVEEKGKDLAVNGEIEDFEDEDVTAFGDDDEDDDGDDDEEEAEEEDEDEEEKLGVEDKFLKINELEEYLEKDEAEEYGLKTEKKKGKKRGHDKTADEEDEEDAEGEEHDDGEDEDGDEFGLMGLDDEDDAGENARYNDFFGGNKGKTTQKRKTKSVHVSDNLEMDEESSDDDNNQNSKLSTHERELERRRSTIEEMEKSNIEQKSWTMLGEVTAGKRPKNSALEAPLDFERNTQPAPVVTYEYSASLEDVIAKKAHERGFDDVQAPPKLPSRAPREVKELDENKSNKGIADIYEEEYGVQTGLVSVAVSLSEQQKKEAKLLFKELSLKLDALSHFHFTPKPVIEDMSIQTNVPAFAMEEIAPVAVSDAAMLAPEEVFTGKGDIKDETELTQAERKRRRANKKRKFKANEAKKAVKSQPAPQTNKDENDS